MQTVGPLFSQSSCASNPRYIVGHTELLGRNGTVARRWRLLGQQTLNAYQRVGVQEERLPSSFADENLYMCKPCFSKAEKFSKLHKDLAVLALSMWEKVNLWRGTYM